MNTPKTAVQLRTYELIAERKLTEVESGTHLFRTVSALVAAGLVAYSRTTGTPGFRRRDGREIPGVTVWHDLHITTRCSRETGAEGLTTRCSRETGAEGLTAPRDGTSPSRKDTS